MDNKELARMFARYCGCKTLLTNKDKRGILIGCDPKDDIVIVIQHDDVLANYRYAPYSRCKLILKRIEDISDEDAIEVAKILNVQYSNHNEDYFFDLKGLSDYLVGLFNRDESLNHYYLPTIVELIDYLRSKGYDIDNLIPRGYAVDEKEVKGE